MEVERSPSVGIEFAHIYAHELDQAHVLLKPAIDALKYELDGRPRWDVSISVLVDDYNTEGFDRGECASELSELFLSEGIVVDHFGFEGDCADVVPSLLDALPDKVLHYVHPDISYQRKTERAHTTVLLADLEEVYYGCAAMATCWQLARFGVEPYTGAMKLESAMPWREFVTPRTLTILPAKYMATEATVRDLVSAIRPKSLRKLVGQMDYVFYAD